MTKKELDWEIKDIDGVIIDKQDYLLDSKYELCDNVGLFCFFDPNSNLKFIFDPSSGKFKKNTKVLYTVEDYVRSDCKLKFAIRKIAYRDRETGERCEKIKKYIISVENQKEFSFCEIDEFFKPDIRVQIKEHN